MRETVREVLRLLAELATIIIAIMQILGGELIPIDVLPPLIETITKFLPFYYINFTPTQWILGRMSLEDFIISLGMGLLWVLIILIVVRYLWNRALRDFEAAGG